MLPCVAESIDRFTVSRGNFALLLALAGLCVTASSSSATVVRAGSVDEEQTQPPTLIILDPDGVVNHISITPGPARSFVVEDRAAPVHAADGSCVSLDIHRVRCGLPSHITVDAGNGDDTILIDSAITVSATIFGGEGADRITAAAGKDFVHGGLGEDELHAGAGDDELVGDNDQFAPTPVQPPAFADVLDGGPGTDRIRYVNNLSGVAANTSPLSGTAVISGVVDQLRAIEQVVTGPGPDVLVGDDANNTLDASTGANVIHGGGGRDILAGMGRFDGGAGPDALQPAGRAQVTCGPGDDGLELRGRAPNPTLSHDCERLFVRAPSGLRAAFIPTVTPSPSVRRNDLRFRFRCTLGAESRQVCRTLMTIRDNNGRELGHARRIVTPNSTGVITVRMSRAIPHATPLRVSLRIGASKGRTRLTRWTVAGQPPATPLRSSSAATRCARSSIEVVAQSTQAVAFRRRGGTRTFVCERSSGRTRYIGQLCVGSRCLDASCFDACVNLDEARMAGRVFAYAHHSAGRGGASYRVTLRAVPTGRVLGRWPTGPLTPTEAADAQYYNEGIGPATDLAVLPNGSVAWIALHRYQRGLREVHAVKATGTDTLLARGRTIRKRSLELRGSTLSWVQAERRDSAQLDSP